MNTFGENLKRVRGDVSQDALAVESGLKQGAISKWETGPSRPNLENLLQLSAGLARLGLIGSVDELLRGIDADYDTAVDRPAARPMERRDELVEIVRRLKTKDRPMARRMLIGTFVDANIPPDVGVSSGRRSRKERSADSGLKSRSG